LAVSKLRNWPLQNGVSDEKRFASLCKRNPSLAEAIDRLGSNGRNCFADIPPPFREKHRC